MSGDDPGLQQSQGTHFALHVHKDYWDYREFNIDIQDLVKENSSVYGIERLAQAQTQNTSPKEKSWAKAFY